MLPLPYVPVASPPTSVGGRGRGVSDTFRWNPGLSGAITLTRRPISQVHDRVFFPGVVLAGLPAVALAFQDPCRGSSQGVSLAQRKTLAAP